jgi:hypothetical protein
MRITGRTLSESEQRRLCARFNEWVKKKREETWSLFLPQFRESKEYARKRMTFELAYHILLHLLTEDLAEDLPETADEKNDAEKKKQPVAEVEPKGDQTDGEKCQPPIASIRSFVAPHFSGVDHHDAAGDRNALVREQHGRVLELGHPVLVLFLRVVAVHRHL